MHWRSDYTWAHETARRDGLPSAFRRSLHVRVVDAGDCGSCLNEIAHLNDPFYNAHRFGIFITRRRATPTCCWSWASDRQHARGADNSLRSHARAEASGRRWRLRDKRRRLRTEHYVRRRCLRHRAGRPRRARMPATSPCDHSRAAYGLRIPVMSAALYGYFAFSPYAYWGRSLRCSCRRIASGFPSRGAPALRASSPLLRARSD